MPGRLDIPFTMAEQPRIFLAWLGSDDSTLTADQKKHINEWRAGHEMKLTNYLHDRYGHYVMVMALVYSQQLANAFWENVNKSCQLANQDMFDRLEKELRGDREPD